MASQAVAGQTAPASALPETTSAVVRGGGILVIVMDMTLLEVFFWFLFGFLFGFLCFT
jgi:hypothetical protein